MKHNYKSTIVAACPSGLGNRMKCMVATIKAAEEKKMVPLLYWQKHSLCGCRYNDLFRSMPFAREIDEDEVYSLNKLYKHFGDRFEFNKTWTFTSSAGLPLDFKFNKLKKKEIAEFVDYFKEFKPTQEIEDVIDAIYYKYSDDFAAGNVIGVHIRKGDYNVSFDGRQHISTDQGFHNKMRALLEINPDYKFLICTEDAETEKKLEDLFGKDKMIYFHKQERGRDNPTAMKEALIDLLLLSKCSIILGTFLSTFTEVAWWLGECKANVCIIGEENREKVEDVWSRLPQPGESIVTKVIRRIKILWRERI